MQKEKDCRELTERLKYRFRNLDLLKQALTHPSCLAGNTDPNFKSYQTLEFVGDRVVNIMAVEELYPLFPQASERELEDNLGLLVNNDRLGAVARQLELGSFLSMSRGADESNLRESICVLACAFEALAGAIFVDSKGDHQLVRSILAPHLFSGIAAVFASRGEFDPKGRLQTLTKSHFGTVPDYTILKSEGEAHETVWTVELKVAGVRLGEGKGTSRKGAEKQAATNVLRRTADLTRDIPTALIERRKLIEKERSEG